MSDRRHISFSQLSTFLQCEKRWLLEQQARLPGSRLVYSQEGTWPMKIGTVVHTVLEMYHHPDNKERTLEALRIFLAAAVEEVPLKDPYHRQAERCVETFWKEFGPDLDHMPDGVEHEVTMPITADLDIISIFDDVTFDHEAKTIIIGEHKTSAKDIRPVEKVWMQFQTYVYQLQAAHWWPDYRLIGVEFTLLTPKTCVREMRHIVPEDAKVWHDHLLRKAIQMQGVWARPAVAFPNYSWSCNRCPFWRTVCAPAQQGVDTTEGGYLGTEDMENVSEL